MHRRSPWFSVHGLAFATALLVLPLACDKGGGTKEPDGGGGTFGEKENKGVEFAYAEQFGLDSQVTIDFSSDDPEGKGQAKVVAKVRLDGAPANGKTKLHAKVVELVEYTGTGALEAEFIKQKVIANKGPADFDLLASLRSAEEWAIVDARGELDDEATKALPENAAPNMAALLVGQFGVFEFPSLPEIPLEVGKTVKIPTEEVEKNLGGLIMPMEIDQSWTLVSLGDVGGRQVAKFTAKHESSGAAELEGGAGMVSFAEESNVVLEFDATARVPISLTGDTTVEFAFEAGGQSQGGQTVRNFAVTYTPAAG